MCKCCKYLLYFIRFKAYRRYIGLFNYFPCVKLFDCFILTWQYGILEYSYILLVLSENQTTNLPTVMPWNRDIWIKTESIHYWNKPLTLCVTLSFFFCFETHFQNVTHMYDKLEECVEFIGVLERFQHPWGDFQKFPLIFF